MIDPINTAPRPPRSLKRSLAALAIPLFILLLILLSCPAVRSLLPGFGGSFSAQAAPLTVYYTCDTSGVMEPCRCSSGQTGGMSRRLGYLASQKDAARLLVDAGDVTAGADAWQRFEFEHILKGYAEAKYDAVNVGQRELSLGLERLRALRKGSVPFISANVFDEQGKLVLEPYRVVKLPGGRRAGIIGIVDGGTSASLIGAGLKVGPPADALSRWLPELKKKAGVIVLLAFTTEDAIKALTEKFPGIDVAVGGKTWQPTGEPLRFGKSFAVMITDQGKAIGRLELAPGEGSEKWAAKNQIVMLTEDLPRNNFFEKVYEDYRKSLAEKDFKLAAETTKLGRSADADRYVGAENCKECHAKAYQAWSASRHAHAFKSLEGQNNHFNPRCLPCHTVGYSATDGYANPKLTPALKDVQCESCHGRGDYHVKNARGEKVPVKKVVLRKTDCKECHNEERSPGFDEDECWKKIQHGK